MDILFVENHARFAAIAVKTFLEEFAVTVVPSLTEARQALAARNFGLVLLDYDLDDGKGDALVPEIIVMADRPLVIAVSSHAAGNQALQQAGADAVCRKSEFSALSAIIAAAVAGVP